MNEGTNSLMMMLQLKTKGRTFVFLYWIVDKTKKSASERKTNESKNYVLFKISREESKKH